MAQPVELLQGTLDLLILKAVSLGPLHGYGILVRIQQLSREAFEIPQGSLYPALYRLEHRGWIASEWGESDNNRRAKYYRLTVAGRKQLRVETAEWNRMTLAVANVLHSTVEEA
ncbi:MAG: PadR family transcriptional regulator [Candidatus Acidiferrales bacterium]